MENIQHLESIKWLISQDASQEEEKNKILVKAFIESALEQPNTEFVVFDYTLKDNSIPNLILKITEVIQNSYFKQRDDFVITDKTIKFTGKYTDMDRNLTLISDLLDL